MRRHVWPKVARDLCSTESKRLYWHRKHRRRGLCGRVGSTGSWSCQLRVHTDKKGNINPVQWGNGGMEGAKNDGNPKIRTEDVSMKRERKQHWSLQVAQPHSCSVWWEGSWGQRRDRDTLSSRSASQHVHATNCPSASSESSPSLDVHTMKSLAGKKQKADIVWSQRSQCPPTSFYSLWHFDFLLTPPTKIHLIFSVAWFHQNPLQTISIFIIDPCRYLLRLVLFVSVDLASLCYRTSRSWLTCSPTVSGYG